MAIRKFTIFGERCSGTNFLAHAILNNFNIPITWEFGYKHFFGHNSFDNSETTLFLCIVRHPLDWINSMYRTPHHLRFEMRHHRKNFMTMPVISYERVTPTHEIKDKEIVEDRNMQTNEYYKNIFELRKVKLDYLTNHLPQLVDNYWIVTLEELQKEYQSELASVARYFDLQRKHREFHGVPNYKGGNVRYNPNRELHNEFTLSEIKPYLDLSLERKHFEI